LLGDISVDQDSINEVVQDAFPQEEASQVEIVAQGLRAGTFVANVEPSPQFLVEPPQDSLSNLSDRDGEIELKQLLYFSDLFFACSSSF